MISEWKESLAGLSLARLHLERDERLRSLAQSQSRLAQLRREYDQAMIEGKGIDYERGVRKDIDFWKNEMTPIQVEIEAIESAIKSRGLDAPAFGSLQSGGPGGRATPLGRRCNSDSCGAAPPPAAEPISVSSA